MFHKEKFCGIRIFIGRYSIGQQHREKGAVFVVFYETLRAECKRNPPRGYCIFERKMNDTTGKV